MFKVKAYSKRKTFECTTPDAASAQFFYTRACSQWNIHKIELYEDGLIVERKEREPKWSYLR